jgi:amidase
MRLLKDRGYTTSNDSWLTTRFRQAGFVIVGKTNTPECGLMGSTEPEAWGPTCNPWNLDFSAGGSSGGSAAAVASGMVPVAYGNDGAGSLRIPASACGIVGLKPTRGRVPRGPAHEALGGFGVEGVLTRSVRDTAAVLDAIAGPMPGDMYTPWPPPTTFLSAMRIPPPRLRVGFLSVSPAGDRAHPDCIRAVENTATLLETLGHSCEASVPAAWHSASFQHSVEVWRPASAITQLTVWERRLGTKIREQDVEAQTWALADAGRALTAVDITLALSAFDEFTKDMARWWSDGFDLLVTPTMTHPTSRLGVIPKIVHETLNAFVVPFNATGQPAISLPLHRDTNGLPCGVQLVAPHGAETLLLQVAAQLEGVVRWSDQLPPIA